MSAYSPERPRQIALTYAFLGKEDSMVIFFFLVTHLGS